MRVGDLLIFLEEIGCIMQRNRLRCNGNSTRGIERRDLWAVMIIGSGSASFEILRYLAERLPLMVAPRWVQNPIRPIAVSDVIHYLTACIRSPETSGPISDIGGHSLETEGRARPAPGGCGPEPWTPEHAGSAHRRCRRLLAGPARRGEQPAHHAGRDEGPRGSGPAVQPESQRVRLRALTDREISAQGIVRPGVLVFHGPLS